MSTETNQNVEEQIPQVPKPSHFPLDRFLGIGNKGKHAENSELSLSYGKQKDPSETLLKKITELTVEADRIVKSCVHPFETVTQSTSTSSTSLNESGSSFTENLVEKKFREVTFKKPKKKDAVAYSSEVNSKSHISISNVYSPKNFEEMNTMPAQMFSKTVKKTYCHIPPASVQKENVSSPLPSSSTCSGKTYITLPTSTSLKGSQSFPARSLTRNHENQCLTESPLSKLGPTKDSTCDNLNVRSSFPEKVPRNTNVKHTVIKKSEVTSRGKGSGGKKTQLAKSTCQQVTEIIPVWDKQYSDACVNTELIKKPNASMVRVISSKEVSTNIDEPRLYQIQELPTVNIRPNLTKQIGPIIDIKVSKPIIAKNNVAVIECIHSEAVNDNLSSNRIDITENEEKSKVLSTSPAQLESKNELKLQKCIRDLIKKLNVRKGQPFIILKESLNTLLMLLNQITSSDTVPFRMINKTIADESIDLFFTNVDVVTELLENELKNPRDKFCRYPEYIIKAVNILSSNIRANFIVKERQRTFVKPSINCSSFENKTKYEKGELNLTKNRKEKTQSKHAIKDISLDKTSTSESSFSKGNDHEIPKEVYIPYRKLVPGGKHKLLEDVSSLKELELRRKRLETINKINQNLRAELPLKDSSISEKEEMRSHVDVNEALNQTFIIESRSDEEKDMDKSPNKTEKEVLKKSDVEYEDDWEQESEVSISGNDPGTTFQKVEVKAQVHQSHGYFVKQPLEELTQIRDIQLTESSSSEKELLAKTNYPSKIKAKIPEQKNPIEPKVLVTTAVQTEIQHKSNSLEENAFSNETKTSREQIVKEPVDTEMKNAHTLPETLSFPVIRMTNPITKSLLEVRLPEQTDKIQSSILVEKSANKEEIKLLYNMNHEEKIQTWPRLAKKDESINTKKQEFSSKNSFSDSNVNIKVVQDEKGAPSRRNSNDFQHITTNFIGFLENKVTEMVSKFKSSEVPCEKLLAEKIKHKALKDSRYYSHGTAFNQLNPNMRDNKTIYKSVSSLFSDKSTEELKFHRNLVSRGCSPENERMKFENLISPPLVLKFKHDAMTQTDNTVIKEIPADDCIRNSQNCSESQNTYEPVKKSKSDNGNLLGKGSEKSLLRLEESNSIKIDKNLRLSDVILDINNETLSQNRLLPLPGDVLKERNMNQKDEKTESYSFQKDVSAIGVQEELFFEINEQAGPSSNEQRPPRQREDSNAMGEHVKMKETIVVFKSLDTCNKDDAETAILQPEVTKIDDDGDSQRTSQILNVLSMTDLGNDFLSSNRQKYLTSDTTKLINHKDGLRENEFLDPIPSTFNATSYSNILQNFFKTRSLENLNAHPKSESIDKTKQNKESVQSLFINSSSKTKVALSTFTVGNLRNEPNVGSQQFCDKPLGESSAPSCNELKEQQLLGNHLMVTNVQKNNRQISLNAGDSSSTNMIREIIDTAIKLPGYVADSDTNSTASDECIPMYYFNSDEMSDGEVRLVYTSNSYSSGEIKPIEKLHESNEVLTKKILKKDLNCSNHRNEAELATFSQSVDSCFVAKCDDNHEEKRLQNDAEVETLPLVISNESSSVADSVSTGELQQILSADDKLDDGIISKLVDIHLQCSMQTSDSPDPVDEVDSHHEAAITKHFTESTDDKTAKD